MRTERTDFQSLNGQFEVVNGTGRRGEMPDVIHRDIQKDKFGDVLLNEFEIRVAAQVRYVIDRAGDKVIDANDFVAAGEQQVGEVRAEEAGGAGDDTRWTGTGVGVFLVSHC